MKPFTWSYSGLSGYETCARQFYNMRIAKRYKDVEGPELKWGNWVHKQLENTLKHGFPLPDELKPYQKWVDFVNEQPGVLFVEQQWGLTRDLAPCGYFAPNVWYRGKGDAGKIDGTTGFVVDWKTGKVKEDPLQLMLMAQCMFSNYPELEKVASMFVWLKHDTHSPAVLDRDSLTRMWAKLLERIAKMEQSHVNVNERDPASVTACYPPNPSGLCKKHCPVMDCEFFQKGNR